MKRLVLTLLLLLAAFSGRAETVTNTYFVVSNVYIFVHTDNVVTQKVKNTHYNYYFTNYVSVVTNYYNSFYTYRTNVSVNVALSDGYVNSASNQANRASGFADDAKSYSESAASSASSASRSASSASASANQASYQRTQAAAECENALSNINARINWFDEHSGETITQYNTNIYFAVDSEARRHELPFTDRDGTADPEFTISLAQMGLSATGGCENTYSIYADNASTGLVLEFGRVEVNTNGQLEVHLKPRDDTDLIYNYNGNPIQLVDAWHSMGKWKFRVTYRESVCLFTLDALYNLSGSYDLSNYTLESGISRTFIGLNFKSMSIGTTIATVDTFALNSQYSEATNRIDILEELGERLEYKAHLADLAASTLITSNSMLRSDVDVLSNDVSSIHVGLADVSNRLDAVEAAYGAQIYTASDGTIYSNISYYATATANGKVAVTTVGNYYPSASYIFYPCYGGSESSYWKFEPAYMDTNAYGMRIHYLPTQAKTLTQTTYNAGYKFVPRDLFWQNGVLYAVVESYNGTNWVGTVTLKYAGTGGSAYPASIGWSSMSISAKEGSVYGGNAIGSTNFGYIKTGEKLSSYDSVLWIPETYSTQQKIIVDWLSTYIRR